MTDGPSHPAVQWTGFFAGPLVAVALYYLLPHIGGHDLTHAGRATMAAIALMATWWLSEALPMQATALVPLVLFPILGIADIKKAAAPYADEVVFLFLGGMLLGVAMERWNLHKRFALWTILAVGTRPDRLVAGVMVAAALISMWVSNTATAVMMLPLGVSIVALIGERLEEPGGKHRDNFAKAMMLGIAYAATIGGIGTVIGSPPNAVATAFIQKTYNVQIDFTMWMKIGLPLMAVFLPLTWLVLVKFTYRFRSTRLEGVHELIRQELRELGRPSPGEVLTFAVFIAAASAWIFGKPLSRLVSSLLDRPVHIADATIAIAAALLLFILPVSIRRRRFVLDWTSASRVPWGVLLLFGGGLSLAAAVGSTGVDAFIGSIFSGLNVHPLVLVLIVTTVVVFATEVGSNTAIVTIFLPVLAPAAVKLGVHPYLLMLPTAIAASYAFMMPTGTPPNALVFASGYLRVADMARAGLILNFLSIAVITVFMYFIAPWALGFDRTQTVAPAVATP
ncbi:MAG: SLC13/DASS family transporter [Phycisphaeraceae bacterium]|nr:SLC13/DASS family transporter [Phycisphaeraceae bacterium]